MNDDVIIVWDSIKYGARYLSKTSRWTYKLKNAKEFPKEEAEKKLNKLNVSVGLLYTFNVKDLIK